VDGVGVHRADHAGADDRATDWVVLAHMSLFVSGDPIDLGCYGSPGSITATDRHAIRIDAC
jgi:hypothetical protein